MSVNIVLVIKRQPVPFLYKHAVGRIKHEHQEIASPTQIAFTNHCQFHMDALFLLLLFL